VFEKLGASACSSARAGAGLVELVVKCGNAVEIVP